MNCWGWGTWKNNWKELENNLQNKIKEEEINRFNFDGFIRNNYQQIVLNEEKNKYLGNFLVSNNILEFWIVSYAK